MRKLTTVLALCLLAVACGKKEPASPLDALPDAGVLQLAISDPASIISNLDGYIASGVPIAGPNLIMSQILAASGAVNVDSLAAWLGLDVHGDLAFYMVGVNPQTIGLAAPVTDPEAFWTRTAEWGVQWTDGDPIGSAVVKVWNAGQMTVNVAVYRGCLLAAASRAELSTMIDRIEGRAPHATVPALEPGALWMKADFSTFGPMVAGQIAMYRPQILSEIEAGSSEAGGMPGNQQMVSSMLGLYFDMIDTFLRETKTVEYSMVFGPEDFETRCAVVWTEGSSIASTLVPVDVTDYTYLLPSANAIAVGRISLPPELSRAAMSAFFTALGSTPDQAYLDLTAEMCRNTCFAMYNDDQGGMHMVGIYGLPQGVDMDTVKDWIANSVTAAQSIMGTGNGMTFTAPKDSVVDGVTYLNYTTTMDFSAMQTGAGAQMPAPLSVAAWLVEDQGMLLLEVGPRPSILPAMLSGSVTEPVSDMQYMASAGLEKEAVFGVELAGYMQMAMRWAGPGASVMDLSALETHPAWVWSSVDLTEGGMSSSAVCKGAEVAAFIGAFATAAGSMATAPAPAAQ